MSLVRVCADFLVALICATRALGCSTAKFSLGFAIIAISHICFIAEHSLGFTAHRFACCRILPRFLGAPLPPFSEVGLLSLRLTGGLRSYAAVVSLSHLTLARLKQRLAPVVSVLLVSNLDTRVPHSVSVRCDNRIGQCFVPATRMA
eukprot:5337654-Pleurochrysis_carterae.AAC.1